MNKGGRFLRAVLASLACVLVSGLAGCGEKFIVKDGEPNAEIVVAEKSPRLVSLAALELQYYLEKMSGARVPIVFEKSDAENIKIYVGKSKYTDEMGLDDKGLKYGAFRMDVGDNYLVLLGHDFDYAPPKPYAVRNGDIKRAKEEWEKILEGKADYGWGFPWAINYKNWNFRCNDEFMAKRYGKENREGWNPAGKEWGRRFNYYEAVENGYVPGFWKQDEGGSLNAVYSFLRSLGAKWYMPTEFGEVIPEVKTIALPEKSKIDKPDFAMRSWVWYNYRMFPFEHIIWARRLGMNSTYEVLGDMSHAHGLALVHATKEMQEKHPEYYALKADGTRATDYRGAGHVCFSSEGLFKETLKYARFMFDEYNQPHVSIWPMDGFHHCQCESCKKLSSSDLVWGFVDKVARELYKTHPDRIVSCGAYTPYIYPPSNVEEFTPNVAVLIANAGRAVFDNPVKWNDYTTRVEGWKKKVAEGMVMRVENNRFHVSGKPSFPVIHPRNMAKDLKYLNGFCMGEVNEESQSGGRWAAPGCDHLHLYVNARFLWDADQDVEAMLAEYYEKFYGPVAEEMRKALEYAQANYSRSSVSRRNRINPLSVSLPVRINLAELLDTAREKAGDTIFGKRIQVIIDELTPLDTLRQELAEKKKLGNPREKTPVVVARHIDDPVKPETHNFIVRSSYKVKEFMEKISTSFSVTWEDNNLIFNIICKEPYMKNLNVADDVWEGDSVVIVLESPSHSFYQMEINPDGKLYDADRSGGGRVVPNWKSMADVKTEKGEDFWKVTVRIPIAVVGEGGAEGDPMNYVIGPKLEDEGEWWINLARRRKHETIEFEDTIRKRNIYKPSEIHKIKGLKDLTGVFSKSRPFHHRKFLDPNYFAKLEIKKKPEKNDDGK